MTTSTAEKRDLKVASNILHHLIFAQAGTIGKAIAELVMNSQDAGADTFTLTIDNNGFIAEDNGRGFQTRKEIEDWFEELGFEHTSDLHQQEGRFSRFGLGRAQIQAFGTTEWNTTTFKMCVDIKGKGLGYDLHVDQPFQQGCRIIGQWYEPLSLTDLKETITEITTLIAHTRIAVAINGNTVNQKAIAWDYETDKVFIKRNQSGDLKVYNQGVLVRSYSGYQYGSGIVVSKVPFALNMARTDILQSTCPIWKEVRSFLREDAVRRSKDKPRLNDSERQLLLNQWISGVIEFTEIRTAPIFEDVSNRKIAPSRLLKTVVTIHTPDCGKQQADSLQQSKVALVLNHNVIEAVGASSPSEAINILNEAIQRQWSGSAIQYVPIENLVATMSDNYQLLATRELSKVDLMGLKSLNKGIHELQRAVDYAYMTQGEILVSRRKPRELRIGISSGAAAWTDGFSYVAINRDFMREHIRDGFRGLTVLANVIVHELCHEANTATAHDHGTEFFQTFHDVLCGTNCNAYGTAIRQMGAFLLAYSQRNGIKLSRSELRDFDREINIERELYDCKDFLQESADSTA